MRQHKSKVAKKALLAHLNAALAETGLGIGQLASEIGMAPSTLDRKLTGRKPLLITDIGALWDVTGISPVELMYGKQRAAELA